MSQLSELRCVPCRGGDPPLTSEQIAALLPQISEWILVEREGIPRLERTFKFKNFTQALAFTDRVGALAGTEDHHPAILTEWGKVTVTWWTHRIKDLHHNDFIMAARTDGLYLSG